MMSKTLFLTGILLAGSVHANTKVISSDVNSSDTPQTMITVTINQQQFQFQSLPRLTEVLAPVALQQDWYWPASSLYKHTTRPEQLRYQTLVLLDRLQQDAPPALQSTWQMLKEQITGWQLFERVNLPIDYDVARIRPAANPAFDPGDYHMRLVTRPTKIVVMGAVANPGMLNHQAAGSLVDYIEQLSFLAVADRNNVVVITPDGNVQHLKTGNGRQQHIELMPGATLLIVTKNGLFSDQRETFNSLLTELARHRVLP